MDWTPCRSPKGWPCGLWTRPTPLLPAGTAVSPNAFAHGALARPVAQPLTFLAQGYRNITPTRGPHDRAPQNRGLAAMSATTTGIAWDHHSTSPLPLGEVRVFRRLTSLTSRRGLHGAGGLMLGAAGVRHVGQVRAQPQRVQSVDGNTATRSASSVGKGFLPGTVGEVLKSLRADAERQTQERVTAESSPAVGVRLPPVRRHRPLGALAVLEESPLSGQSRLPSRTALPSSRYQRGWCSTSAAAPRIAVVPPANNRPAVLDTMGTTASAARTRS